MVDEKVLEGQRWVNERYSDVAGYSPCPEDGATGWSTMYALTMGLQHELGISPVVANFGPSTLSRLQSHGTVGPGEDNANIVNILQYALFAKGYWGGDGDGNYGESTMASAEEIKRHMGVAGAYPGAGVEPKVFKAILNMDPYVLVSGGTERVRTIQQWMNDRYVGRRDFFIIPCDGRYSRDVAKALMLAIQFELGMSDDQANGVFGPGTQDGLRQHSLSVGSQGTWVQLFSAAMVFNDRQNATFTATYTDGLAYAVSAFQDFTKLSVTGTANFQTWASLLVSTGDPSRRGTACDCVTEITPARAQALRDEGYLYVGRYLTNVPNTSLDKMIKPGELDTIAEHGLRVFPIYQTWGGSADYFNAEQGTADALAAVDAASQHGFQRGTRIYFAVDFDALDHEVTENIIPHFRAIKQNLEYLGRRYQLGIYGPRNVCSRVAADGSSTASFVSDMSTGFSGNLGYPLPLDWAYDQIATITVGSGDGRIEIDNNIASGRDLGQNEFEPVPPDQKLDVRFNLDYSSALLTDIQEYMVGLGVGETSELTEWSTTECVEILLRYDLLIASLARTLRMRKSLIQVPIFWESRNYKTRGQPTENDLFSDACVVLYHTGGIPDWAHGLPVISGLRDSSTGLAQIFGVTAIESYNYSIRQGIITGTIRDSENDDHLWDVWQQLNQDNVYCISTVPHVHFRHAELINAERPGLDIDEQAILNLLIRYQGELDESDAQQGGALRLGLYRIVEQYNSFMRNL